MRASSIRIALFLCLFALPNLHVLNGAVFTNPDAGRHERYLTDGSPNPDFILDEASLSGIGGRAALISPLHVITAAHNSNASSFRANLVGSDGVLRSYSASNSTDLSSNTITDVNGDPIAGSSDIRIFTLDMAVDLDFNTPIAIAIGDVSDFIGEEVFVLGQGNQAGKNIIDSVQGAAFGGMQLPRASFVIQFDHDTPTNGGANGLIDEASLEGGDSGSQVLLQIGDELALVGSHFGIEPNVNPANQPNYDSFSSFLSPYIDEIDSIVASDGVSIRTIRVAAVPEPSTAMLIGISGLILSSRRKRSQNIHPRSVI